MMIIASITCLGRLSLGAPILFLATALAFANENSDEVSPAPQADYGPLSPNESLAQIKVASGLRVELVASEPHVIDPVAVRFDEQGRMWVVEMRDYPHGPAEGQPGLSQIRVLEDRDHDGRYETSRVFATDLLFPTGLQPWQGGVIVTLSGRVAFLKDTTGDGKADQFDTWYTGFAEKNPQLRANHPYLGLDNHIYVANGLQGGKVMAVNHANNSPLSIDGRDFRFHPITRKFEAVSGNGQFGLTQDDYGNRFVCTNRNPLRHIVLEERYIRLNPDYAPPAAVTNVTIAPAQLRLYPLLQGWTTSLRHAGQFTAACGVLIYHGNGLPGSFHGNAFTCDPTGSLVHQEVLQESGGTFRSQPARKGAEFLASADPWFQPVNLTVGPDGALYVVDIYRAIIEHPQWMPDELQQREGFRLGDDRGRIYRVVADDAGRKSSPQCPDVADVDRLVGLLEHPNSWQRETASRLLLERGDRSAVEPLEKLVIGSPNPATRVRALWALRGLDALKKQTVAAALDDPEPRVRRQAVVLTEAWLANSASLRESVMALSHDPHPRVRFQVALSLAVEPRYATVELLHAILLAGVKDPWTRRAVAIAAGNRSDELLMRMLKRPDWIPSCPDDVAETVLRELIVLSGRPIEKTDWQSVIHSLARLPTGEHQAGLQRRVLTDILRTVGTRHEAYKRLTAFAEDATGLSIIQGLLSDAERIAKNIEAEEEQRAEAIALLAYVPGASTTLATLAIADLSETVRRRAIGLLGDGSYQTTLKRLFEQLPHEPPAIRRAVVNCALQRPETCHLLLAEISDGRISAGELNRRQIDALRKHRDESVRERGREVLVDTAPEDRAQVLAEYQKILEMEADARRGVAVFRKNCATCHRVGQLGVEVAPNIEDSYGRKREQLLTDILQPNRAIDADYVNYVVETVDGRALSGILAAQTASSVTVRQPEGKTVTLLRREIEQIRSTGVSLMPDGLEKDISPQQMADLIAFVKNWRYFDQPLLPPEARE